MTLYLKYRPQDFDSLEGQSFIKNTLKQAILKDKLVGAYLFCGPRGTGKTSTARIFAKAINCLNPKDGNPCLECEICKAFSNESLVDIIEIDAASYTGVDNIREIIEKAKFSPTKCKYKVYIIDEVHMLSKGAFNALLKILEEPPSHLKFILATTEIHKIPETILSRCQRYDFKSLSNDDLKNRLNYIAQKEGIKIDTESLDFILKQANGGARNAISLFEQLIYNDEINFQTIINNYGIPKNEVILNFLNKLISKDVSVIGDFENICKEYQINLFIKELIFLLKDKLLENLSNDDFLKSNIYIIEILEKAFFDAKNSTDPKTTFLIGIIKCIKGQSFINSISTEIKPTGNIVQKPISTPEVKQTTISTPVITQKEVIPEEITSDDLFDIFGENEIEFSNPAEVFQDYPPITENIPNTQPLTGNKNFDKETFISKLKDLKAKGALTMSLRGSDIALNNDKLIIYAKTFISVNQISNADNVAIMNEALKNMGIDALIEVKSN